MRLLIKQRLFTLTDNYYVYDQAGNVRYQVEDALFRLGHQLHVYDAYTGREVGSIHQQFFTFTPEFEIVIGGRVMGTIRKEFTFFTPRYHVDYLGWEVQGDLLGWDYQVFRNGRQILSISKEILNLTDTYVLDYADPSAEIAGLMLVIAIDAVNCSKK